MMVYIFRPRKDETCDELRVLFMPFVIGMLTPDDWGRYARALPKEKHLTTPSLELFLRQRSVNLECAKKEQNAKHDIDDAAVS